MVHFNALKRLEIIKRQKIVTNKIIQKSTKVML